MAKFSAAVSNAPHCYLCGEPIPRGVDVRVRLDGAERAMCCHGCATVALWTASAKNDGGENESCAAARLPASAAMQEAKIELHGVSCASCVWAIDAALDRIPGIGKTKVDVVRQRLEVSWDPAQTSIDAILAAVRAIGYGAEVGGERAQRVRRERRGLQRMLVAALCMMQVMMLSVPAYMAAPGEIDPDIEQLLRIAQLLLSLPVFTFCAWPIYQAAWRDMRGLRIGMDVPVTLGLAVALGESFHSIWASSGALYFDSITMFVSLLLASRWLQGRGLARAASYLDQLSRHSVPQAQRLTDYPASTATETISSVRLACGDLIWVRPGESFPADGTVVQGESACSEALLTGESRPASKRMGDSVLASGVNLENPLVVRVDRVGEHTALAALTRLAEAAHRSRPPLVAFAERAARGFMWVVMGLVLLAAGIWWFIDPEKVVPVSIAILIVTCPCALSLAVPVALSAAQAALARRGVLVTRASAIEVLGRVSHIAFDKTGTLTQGRMRLVEVQSIRNEKNERSTDLIRTAAALEAGSNHPIAVALRAAADGLPSAQALCSVAGSGVEGVVDGRRLRFGKAEFVAALAPNFPAADVAPSHANASLSLLGDADGPIAWFGFADPLRADAAQLVASLRAHHKQISILSGDRLQAVHAVARELGIDAFRAEALPEDKRAAVHALQEQGKVVAMIGDGLNDAPVIAQADVSAAFASASTLAQTRADFLLLSDRLSDFGTCIATCESAQRIIKQNLSWALLYNLVAIPVAASGYISPAWASIGMAASSLLVVANALRLLPRAGKASATTESSRPVPSLAQIA